MNSNQSPRIKNHSWGEILVDEDGEEQAYKDAKLFPGGSRGWDWNETGTHHSPGIQPEDVQELIEQGSEIIILSQGVYERLGVCRETEELLKQEGVEYYIEDTKKAIKTYNELQKNRKVGGLFHSTC